MTILAVVSIAIVFGIVAGHDFGFFFNNPVYKDEINKENNYGYEVIKTIEDRETYDTEYRLIIET